MNLFEELATATKPAQLQTENNECAFCDGKGYNIWSCCGDDITHNIDESDLCPSCLEHCGDEKEECDFCNGSGIKNVIN